jgi:hypothetical protein
VRTLAKKWVWWSAVVLAAVALGIVAAPAHAKRQPVSGYCTPSGDYCISVFRESGAILFGIHAFFGGRYSICVTDPLADRECKSFRLHSIGGKYPDIRAGQVRWYDSFAVPGLARTESPGTTQPCAQCLGTPIGRVLKFTVRG